MQKASDRYVVTKGSILPFSAQASVFGRLQCQRHVVDAEGRGGLKDSSCKFRIYLPFALADQLGRELAKIDLICTAETVNTLTRKAFRLSFSRHFLQLQHVVFQQNRLEADFRCNLDGRRLWAEING